ncbi:MAG: hypothetical protein JNM27_05760 [Leptospirales bacterium]|nr:hypothetical protein [Leptospirales bacterium]
MIRAVATILFLLLLSCSIRSALPGGDTFTYSDDVSFSVTVPIARVKPTKAVDSSSAVYEFREITGNETTAIVRVRSVDVNSADDLFAPGYEPAFLKECQCVVAKRGVTHMGSLAAREYVVSLNGGSWTGYQRHVARDKKIIVVEVSGAAEQDVRVQSMFRTLTESLKLIPGM